MQVYIQATGDKGAEMVTDQGAIYVTSNGGYNWKAAIQESVSATLNRLVSSEVLAHSLWEIGLSWGDIYQFYALNRFFQTHMF